ncbi:NADPH:quinone reductase-like protein [Microdochium trichocladiopsis]|uniref:NADPH:quinone reductase-like protein n=1 Tax=Microdochium trichocladiopsis TaxID=1682393 RepID=A0A9P9BQ72_9PEZI|nr:NADPH:quinone reductase-like protein [Microdochium trichocladiopsis]KAH7034573.1 NADPH:quinone reductase-like protein [Microdochium trichocladiopsis]
MTATAAPNMTDKMRAWLYTSAPNGLEKALFLSDNAKAPRMTAQGLGKSDIVVRVEAASINPADYKLPEMTAAVTPRFLASSSSASLPKPDEPAPSGAKSPGFDFAGTVAATGAAVDTFRVGERVFGRCKVPPAFGTLGEYVVASYDGLCRLPDNVSFEQGAAVGTAALTAYQCIAPYVTPNSNGAGKVFINGGSGGTGTWGIQIAKALGCHVTTTCSARNVDFVRSLGADEVIDYTSQDVVKELTAKGKVFKLVVDNVGTPANLYKAADDFLVPQESHFVQVGAASSAAGLTNLLSRSLVPSFLGGGKSKFIFFLTKNIHADLEQLAAWMKEEKVEPVIDEVFEWTDAPAAYAKLKTSRARGNIVVKGAPAIKN